MYHLTNNAREGISVCDNKTCGFYSHYEGTYPRHCTFLAQLNDIADCIDFVPLKREPKEELMEKPVTKNPLQYIELGDEM